MSGFYDDLVPAPLETFAKAGEAYLQKYLDTRDALKQRQREEQRYKEQKQQLEKQRVWEQQQTDLQRQREQLQWEQQLAEQARREAQAQKAAEQETAFRAYGALREINGNYQAGYLSPEGYASAVANYNQFFPQHRQPLPRLRNFGYGPEKLEAMRRAMAKGAPTFDGKPRNYFTASPWVGLPARPKPQAGYGVAPGLTGEHSPEEGY